jgi:CubicO group peptidase (beta-lactamase class C family)
VLRLLLVIAFALAPSAGTLAQNRLPTSAAIDAYLTRAIEDTKIPGAVAMVADANGVLYSGAFGAQDVGKRVPMAVDSIFRIASMTKPVTSVAVMMLVDEGKVALDDPVASYLPAFEEQEVIATFNGADKTFTTRPAATPMTVRHLLTHTSGLGYSFSSPVLAALMGNAQGASATAYPLLHDPGTRWTYGESTRVLGSLVEEVSGEPLDRFLAERIFEPLDMNDTFYTVPAAKNGRVVTIHVTNDQGLVETPNGDVVTSPVYGDGGLSSTAADYVKFMQMLLNNGRAPDGTQLLRPETVKLMGQNHTGRVRVELQETTNDALSLPFPLGAGRDTYGLGFQVTGAHNDRGSRSPGSLSWAGIFNTEFWIDPAKGIGGVLLMQYLPFYDTDAIATLQGFEQRVYEGLED